MYIWIDVKVRHDIMAEGDKRRRKKRITFPDIENNSLKLTREQAENVPKNRKDSRFLLPSVYREKTQVLPSTNLDNLLEEFRETHVEPQPSNMHRMHLSAKDILCRLIRVMRLTKYSSHTVAPSNREPILVGDLLDKTCILPGADIDFLVPLIFSASFRKRDLGNGYATLALPDKLTGAKDVYSLIRANDRIHLSPTKVYRVFYKMLRQAVRDVSVPDLDVDLCQMSSGSLDLILKVGDTFRIHVIPTIAITCKQTYLTAKPYDYHGDILPDISWRHDYFKEEKKLLDKVTTADKGQRKLALKIVKAIAHHDNRLSLITPYHLKTSLFHLIESEIDFYPGWQRKPLKSCVLELFENVLDAVESKWLPHIQLSGLNLFNHFPSQGRGQAVKLLRQLSEDKGLIRFLRRTMASAEIKYFE